MSLNIIKDYNLAKLSTLRVQATAEFFARPESEAELLSIIEYAHKHSIPCHFLGAGSNTLLSSRKIEGIVISTSKLDKIVQLSDEVFEVGSGLQMPRFCGKMIHNGLAGAEFMVGIPGSIGGGIVMNAGAHGSEMSSIVQSVKILNTKTLKVEDIPHSKLGFKYRHSNIRQGEDLIISAKIALKLENKEEIRARVKKFNASRIATQPVKAWTCGCTFTNPTGYSAGKLIHELNLKNLQVGDFKISDVHANFFENLDQGTSMEFCQLVYKVQSIVSEKLSLKLTPEVRPIGEFNADESLIWQ